MHRNAGGCGAVPATQPTISPGAERDYLPFPAPPEPARLERQGSRGLDSKLAGRAGHQNGRAYSALPRLSALS